MLRLPKLHVMQNGDDPCAETGLRCARSTQASPFLASTSASRPSPRHFSPTSALKRTAIGELGVRTLQSSCDLFNFGTLLLGVAWLIASVGFFRAFQRLGVHPLLAWPIRVALIVAGIASFWAGWYPLPDPRPAAGRNPGSFLVAILSLPILLPVALETGPSGSANDAYFVAGGRVAHRYVSDHEGGFTGLGYPHLSRTIPADVRAHSLSACGNRFPRARQPDQSSFGII